MGGLISAALLASAATALPDGRLHVTFFELDSGNATLIETPSGRQILIDAGGGGRRLSAALGGTLPFWDRSIDLLVITQPGSAHTNGLPALMRRYRFDAVLTNGVRGNNQVMQPVWAELDESGTPQVVARQGMRIRVDDGVTLTVLRAQIDPPASTDDPGEPVSVMIAYDTLRVLIPGDLTAEGEAALLNSDVFLDATVLVVPRSGHRQATSEALLAAASPQIAVIAIPTDNDSLPHQETLDRLGAAQIVLYRTDQVGSVEIVSDGTQMWVRTER
jgi:competence protein ComEC